MKQSVKSFLENRFGMFIHFGPYSVIANNHGEWSRSIDRIDTETYEEFVRRFNPEDYDPKKWAEIAKKAGMKYAVLTAKHHDGYCLFDSMFTDYSSKNYLDRDLVREYVEAFRKAGIKVGLYYSLLDWHREDYPTYGDRFSPMRDNPAFKDKPYDLGSYVHYVHQQIKELLTNYGEIDLLWLDFSYTNQPPLPNMSHNIWRSEELLDMVYKLQPQIVVNNRLDLHLEDFVVDEFIGDFVSPEQIVPNYGVVNSLGEPVPWEVCITMNNHWAYDATDKNFKTSRQIIRKLVECTSKNGNLILNIGPDARGNFPKESIDILLEVGSWMHLNGESIYGAGKSRLSKPSWGYYTRKDQYIFAHIFDNSSELINFRGLKGKVDYAYLLDDNSNVTLTEPWNVSAFKEDTFWSYKAVELPNLLDTVVCLKMKERE
ncbi:alpha-L-fucosidase [Enterococcus casseliflavus]|nr:alpha-L-fucosidase [Enterococcus casseliflavus]